MKWTAATVAVALSMATQSVNAFTSTPWKSLQHTLQQKQVEAAAAAPPPRRRIILTPLRVAYDAIDAEVDYFYEDEDPEDPSEMKLSEIKMELDLMNIDYSDYFDRSEMEQRLREARENPSKFQHQQQKTWQPQDGPIGMKSVETSFEGIKQNVYNPSSKTRTQSFFGNVEGSIEVESSPSSSRASHNPRMKNITPRSSSSNESKGPPRWTQDAILAQDQNQQYGGGSSSGGGQSLEGFLEQDEKQHQQRQTGGANFDPGQSIFNRDEKMASHSDATTNARSPPPSPPHQPQRERPHTTTTTTPPKAKKSGGGGGWDPSQMSAEQIKAELDTFGVDYSDCRDHMDLLERWENARQGKTTRKAATATTASFSSSSSSSPSQQPKPKPQGRDAVRLEDRFAKHGDRFSSDQIEKPPTSTTAATTTKEGGNTSGVDRFSGTHPKNGSPRWTQFDGVQVEAAGKGGIHFETDSAYSIYNQKLHLEEQTPQEQKRSSRRTPGPAGTSMWDGIRVEPAGTTHTDDPFRSTRRQQQRHRQETMHNEQGPGAAPSTKKNQIRLEKPPEDPFGIKGRKYYGKANELEKEKYTERRDFRNDQQAKSTTIFKGIQVEEVPPPDDIKVSSYNREEQGGGIHYYKDFRADPQRADHHALYKGIQVECAPDEDLPSNAVPTSRAPGTYEQQNKASRGGVVGVGPGGSSQTTSFQGYSSSSGSSKSVQEQLYDKQNNNPAAAAGNTPDDPFVPPTLEHPHPEFPRRTTHNDVRVNTDSSSSSSGFYEGQWEKTVGGSNSSGSDTNGGGVSGNMDIDGRL